MKRKTNSKKRQGLGTYRIPTTGAGEDFKDKKKYNRKRKHKKNEECNS